MASCLHHLKARLPLRAIASELVRSHFSEILNKPLHRNVITIAINNETTFDDVLPVRKTYEEPKKKPLDLYSLKKKEKDDWRLLTMEEKKALYHLSLENPLWESSIPADDWKPILASTFIAMGLMTLGIYAWFTRFAHTEYSHMPNAHKAPSNEMMINFATDEKADPVLDVHEEH